jgi:hypothetical protein
VGPTGIRVTGNRRIASFALAGLVAFSATLLLSGCSSDGVFPAIHDMPAARTETKLTPDEVKQATDDLISERDRTEAQGQTPAQTPGQTPAQPPATTGSVRAKKQAASAQPQTPQSPVSISAYAKQ